MLKNKIKKVLAGTTAAISLFALMPTVAQAAWKKDNTGWWYTEGSSWSVGWRYIDGTWYYFDDSGYMATGWRYINNDWYFMNSSGAMQTGWIQSGKWYYCYSDGRMAHDTVINGYIINSNGEWVENYQSSGKRITIDADKAKQLLEEADGNYLKGKEKEGLSLVILQPEETTINAVAESNLNIPNETCYHFVVWDNADKKEHEDLCNYLVGRETGNVYVLFNQGGFEAYQVKNNTIVKTFRTSSSVAWR